MCEMGGKLEDPWSRPWRSLTCHWDQALVLPTVTSRPSRLQWKLFYLVRLREAIMADTQADRQAGRQAEASNHY
jgi:hypothetical protein